VLTAGNKKALVRQLPLNVRDELLELNRNFVMDGELVGTEYFPFDLISIDGKDISHLTLSARYGYLLDLVGHMGNSIHLVRLETTLVDKTALIANLEISCKEGFVIKNLLAAYEVGESHGTQWKHQFRSVVACIVGARNGNKNSVEVFVKRPDGSNRSMGNVTVPNTYSIPKPGEIAEIENLYVHPGKDGKFAQAVFKGVRTDADENDCREDKLRVKSI
jgi:bifunctional non-homologous end joining protein LigD